MPTPHAHSERVRLLIDVELMQTVHAAQTWIEAAFVITGDPDDKLPSAVLFEALADAVGRDDEDHTLLRVVGLNQRAITRATSERFGLNTSMFWLDRQQLSGWRGVRLDADAGNRAISPAEWGQMMFFTALR